MAVARPPVLLPDPARGCAEVSAFAISVLDALWEEILAASGFAVLEPLVPGAFITFTP